jgi:hypothetical protein
MSIWTKEIDRRTLLKGSAIVEPRWLDVTRHVVRVDGLSSALEG